jgi:hypothetical protein
MSQVVELLQLCRIFAGNRLTTTQLSHDRFTVASRSVHSTAMGDF